MVTSLVLAPSSLGNTHPRLLADLSEAPWLPLQQEKGTSKGIPHDPCFKLSRAPLSSSWAQLLPLYSTPQILSYTLPQGLCACLPSAWSLFPLKDMFFQPSVKHHLFKDRPPFSRLPLLRHLTQFVTPPPLVSAWGLLHPWPVFYH